MPASFRARPLDPATDPALFSGVTFGPEPYAVEVEEYLRGKAVILEERGECATTVFLLPNKDLVIGFYSTRSIKLIVDEAFREAFEVSKTKARKMPSEFDACYLVAFGVNIDFHRQGYATELHLHLVESLTSGAMRPPFIFLKVWQDNPAAWVYDRWEYRNLGEEEAYRSTDQQKLLRWLMAAKVRD
jgi:ribosomal protein S18 acetylase RimI-like enzyme